MLYLLPLILTTTSGHVQPIDTTAAAAVLLMNLDRMEQPVTIDDIESPASFLWGKTGTWRWGVYGGYAEDMQTSFNKLTTIGVEFEYFVEDNLSIDIGLHYIDVDQIGSDSNGFHATLQLRWHFLDKQTWSMFIEGGAGLLRTDVKVPITGSRFNFTPQAGIGLSFDIGNRNRWLIGLRWHHISNANLYSTNPGRDSLMIWTGISFPY